MLIQASLATAHRIDAADQYPVPAAQEIGNFLQRAPGKRRPCLLLPEQQDQPVGCVASDREVPSSRRGRKLIPPERQPRELLSRLALSRCDHDLTTFRCRCPVMPPTEQSAGACPSGCPMSAAAAPVEAIRELSQAIPQSRRSLQRVAGEPGGNARIAADLPQISPRRSDGH